MTIELYKANGSWIAEHRGPGSEEIKRLFGTTALPTAFTDKADAYRVKESLERLNPDDEVIIYWSA